MFLFLVEYVCIAALISHSLAFTNAAFIINPVFYHSCYDSLSRTSSQAKFLLMLTGYWQHVFCYGYPRCLGSFSCLVGIVRYYLCSGNMPVVAICCA